MPFLLKLRISSPERHLKGLLEPFKIAIGILLNGLTAFVGVFLFHSYFRGNGSIIQGANSIYQEDVLRRTYGDPANFDPLYEASLSASVFEVLWLYVFKWQTPLLNLPVTESFHLGLGRTGLFLLLALVFNLLALHLALKKKVSPDILVALVGALAVPLSWFILAKGHSHVHLHINYILWYPVTLPVLLYLGIGIPARIIKDYVVHGLRRITIARQST